MTATRNATALASLAAAGVAVVIALSLVPVWPLELFEHFRAQYLVISVVVVVACAALRVRGFFDTALIAALVNLALLVTGMRPARDIPAGTPVRVLLLNVHTSSSSFADVRALIADTNADLVALVEVDRRWLDALAPALTAYAPLEHPRDDNFGLALYARGSLTGEAAALGTQLPSLVARATTISGTSLGIVLTHPLPPVSSRASTDLTAHLVAVAHAARAAGDPVIVLGDFNTTPWSRPFATLLATSGLCDTRDGFGLQATFPSSLALARIPIDHVLTSCAIGVRDRRVERDVGSDHLPVVVDLVVP